MERSLSSRALPRGVIRFDRRLSTALCRRRHDYPPQRDGSNIAAAPSAPATLVQPPLNRESCPVACNVIKMRSHNQAPKGASWPWTCKRNSSAALTLQKELSTKGTVEYDFAVLFAYNKGTNIIDIRVPSVPRKGMIFYS